LSASDWQAAALVDDTALDDGLPKNFWETAQVMHPKRKKLTTLRLDEDLIEWFKQEAERTKSKGYQTMMHSVLAAYRRERGRVGDALKWLCCTIKA
jgi:uncharacterized protein (DUF4415 family)